MLPEITSLGGSVSGVNPLTLLILVLGILFGLVIILVNLKLVLDIAPYAYPNAKIRSMQSMLIGKRRLDEMVGQELMNITRVLDETDYADTSRAIVEEADITIIEATLNRNLMESFGKITGFLPGDAKTFFQKYLMSFEVEAIKTVLRGIYGGLAPEKIENALAEPYREALKEAASSSTVAEAVSKMEGSEFGRTLSRSLHEFEAEGNLLPLEQALDRSFYQMLMEVLLTHPSPDSLAIKRLLGTEIDILNIQMLLRGARDGVDVSDHLIPYGFGISVTRLTEIGTSADVGGIVSSLEGTPYHKPLYGVMDEYMTGKDRSLTHFEKALDAYYLSAGQAMATRQAFGLGPVLSYVSSKRSEVKDIFALIQLKMEGFSSEEIKKVVF